MAPEDECHMATIQESGKYEHLWSGGEPPAHEEEHSCPDPEKYGPQDQFVSSGQDVKEEHMRHKQAVKARQLAQTRLEQALESVRLATEAVESTKMAEEVAAQEVTKQRSAISEHDHPLAGPTVPTSTVMGLAACTTAGRASETGCRSPGHSSSSGTTGGDNATCYRSPRGRAKRRTVSPRCQRGSATRPTRGHATPGAPSPTCISAAGQHTAQPTAQGSVALEYMQAWRDSLATVGLSLNWNPRQLDLPIDFQEAFPDAQHTTEGFRVCGLPLDQADPDDHQDFALVGSGAFTQEFLAEARRSLRQRLRTLSTFVQTLGSHAEGLHVALTVARVKKPLAVDMPAWLAELLDLPLVTPHALLALQLPTTWWIGLPSPPARSSSSLPSGLVAHS